MDDKAKTDWPGITFKEPVLLASHADARAYLRGHHVPPEDQPIDPQQAMQNFLVDKIRQGIYDVYLASTEPCDFHWYQVAWADHDAHYFAYLKHLDSV